MFLDVVLHTFDKIGNNQPNNKEDCIIDLKTPIGTIQYLLHLELKINKFICYYLAMNSI